MTWAAHCSEVNWVLSIGFCYTQHDASDEASVLDYLVMLANCSYNEHLIVIYYSRLVPTSDKGHTKADKGLGQAPGDDCQLQVISFPLNFATAD